VIISPYFIIYINQHSTLKQPDLDAAIPMHQFDSLPVGDCCSRLFVTELNDQCGNRLLHKLVWLLNDFFFLKIIIGSPICFATRFEY
jgi:hypothetical protein